MERRILKAPPVERPREAVVELETAMESVRVEMAKLIVLEQDCSFGAMSSRPDLIDRLVRIDTQRRVINAQLELLEGWRPDSESPIRPLYVGDTLDTLVDVISHRIAWVKKNYPDVLERPPVEWHNRKTVEAYKDYFRSNERIGNVKNRANEIANKVEVWKVMHRAYSRLGIDASAEDSYESETTHAEDAVELGRKRSFKNIRKSVSNFLKRRERWHDQSHEEVLAAIEAEMQRQQPTLLSYYETVEDVEAILDSGSIKNLFELSDDEQEKRKKSLKGVSQIQRERQAIEGELGWSESQTVYHLIAETPTDETIDQPPSENYGAVRFVFDANPLEDRTTFTEGDSLNPNGVPYGLLDGKGKSAQARQLMREHVPLAKALFALARPEMQKFNRVLSYVEAQVGGIDGAELFNQLSEVTIDESEWEQECARLDDHRVQELMDKIENFCKQREVNLRMI